MTSKNKQEEEFTVEELLEAARDRIKELEEALRKEIHFRTATDVHDKEIWIPAIDALHLFVPLNKARRHAIDNNDPWHKVIFTVTNEGRITDANLEEEEAEDKGQNKN